MEINSKYKRCFASVLSTAGLSAFRYFEIRKTKPKVITTANQNKAKFQMEAMRIMMIMIMTIYLYSAFSQEGSNSFYNEFSNSFY